MKKHRGQWIRGIMITGVFLSPAHAVEPPDAGRLLAPLVNQEGAPAAPAVDLKQAPRDTPRPPAGGEQVLVKGFQVLGNTVVSGEAVNAVLAAYSNRSLEFEDLQAAAAAVTRLYHEHGYLLGRAYLPAQEITNGIVQINVQEGTLGRVVLPPDQPGLRGEHLRRIIEAEVSPGQVVQEKDLERALILLNETPGLRSRGLLEPGDKPGTSDLNLEILHYKREGIKFDYSNTGSPFTGRDQLGSTLQLDGVSGHGDALTVRALASTGLSLVQGLYAVPLVPGGWKASLSTSRMQYELGEAFAGLQARGGSRSVGAHFAYPLIRSVTGSLTGSLGYDYRRYSNEAGGTMTSDKAGQVLLTRLGGVWQDRRQGGGVSRLDLTLTGGDLDLGRVADALEADRAGPQTAGKYGKISYSLSREQMLGSNWSLYGGLSGQAASANLDSSEKLDLGGQDGVRAYPEGEASGDSGHVLTLELRHRQPLAWGELTLGTFLDHGRTRLHKDPWNGWQGGNSRLHNSYSLSGAGVLVQLTTSRNLFIRAIYARGIGDNPGRDSAGRDSDGETGRARGWLQMGLSF